MATILPISGATLLGNETTSYNILSSAWSDEHGAHMYSYCDMVVLLILTSVLFLFIFETPFYRFFGPILALARQISRHRVSVTVVAVHDVDTALTWSYCICQSDTSVYVYA